MNDFAKLIQQELENGMTKEELTKRFADALNTQDKTSARQRAIDDLEQGLLSSIREGRIGYIDAAAALTLTTATDSPIGKNWDVNQIDHFFNFATQVMTTIPKEFDLFEKLANGAGQAGASLSQLVTRLMDTIKKSEHDQKSCKCGDSCEIPKPKSDGDTIADFLKDLFD